MCKLFVALMVHNFFYCGCGTYCKTKQEALLFIQKSKESFEEVIDRDA